jgi:serine/threonine protein kinase
VSWVVAEEDRPRYLDRLCGALLVTAEGFGQYGDERGRVLSGDIPVQLAGLRPGSMLAGYRLEAQVGAGGMAVVFRARDERLGRRVALKVLAPALTADAGFRRRFVAESRAAAAVDDPHIIPVYEAGEADGVLFIAMRFVASGDLRGVLEREGTLAPARTAAFVSPVALALDAAHGVGLVHRDVKPANILVDVHPGRPEHVYLSDFGVSKGAVSSVSLTGAGHFVGTPDYSAPEQIQGLTVDGRTDQYALACVAYQLLAGVVPFGRDQGMAVLFAHLSASPPSLLSWRPELPGGVDQVLARALAKAPQQRYECCQDFAEALREALGLAPSARAVAAPAPGHRPPQAVPPPLRFSGSAATGTGKAEVSADLAAAATMDSGSPVDSRPRGPAGEEQPAPTQDAANRRPVPGAPFTGKDGRYSGNHRYADQDGTGEPAPPGPGPGSGQRGGRANPAPRARSRFSRLGWLTAGLVLVAGLGFAGYKFLGQPHVDTPESPPTATTGTATPSFDAALGKWQDIGTRTEDPQPLTLEQLFPLKLNGSSYTRTGTDSLTGNCSLAVFGANLQEALQAGHCTQMLRATYISPDGTMMGTVGVANLINSDAATKAGQVTGPTEIIAPLAGQNGPTSKLGDGTGVVQSEIKGHYLILTWAEFTSLKSPSTSAQQQQLVQFMANMISGSANIDLSSRMAPWCASAAGNRRAVICRTTAIRTLTVIRPATLAAASAIASGSP